MSARSRVVGLLQRRAEQGHDSVAGVGDERPSGGQDRLGHLLEVHVHHGEHLLAGERLREARESAQVAEQDRAVTLDGAEAQVLVGSREHLVDDAAGHEAREQRAGALALHGLAQVQDGERAHRPDRQREQRVDDVEDPSRVEGQLAGDEVQRAHRERERERPQPVQADAHQRRDEPEQHHERDGQPAGRVAQGQIVEHRVGGIRLDLGAGLLLVAGHGGGVHVLQRRRRRPDEDDLVAEQGRVEVPAVHARERRGGDVAGGSGEVDRDRRTAERPPPRPRARSPSRRRRRERSSGPESSRTCDG